MLFIGVGIIAWITFKGWKDRSHRLKLEAEIKEILGREEIQLLRHRDFEGFCKKVNKIRARKGQTPVDAEFLAKIQYNLMYALDESDF
jgi:hypothetical protein